MPHIGEVICIENGQLLLRVHVNRVVLSGVTAKTISPSVLDSDVERVAGGVLRAEDLNWVVEVVYVAVCLDKV